MNGSNKLNERVRWIVDEFYAGKVTHFAHELGFSKASVSQWIRSEAPYPIGYSSLLKIIKFFRGRLREEWLRYGQGEPLEPPQQPDAPATQPAVTPEVNPQQQFVEAQTADEQLAIESLEREIERNAIELEKQREALKRLRAKQSKSGGFHSAFSFLHKQPSLSH